MVEVGDLVATLVLIYQEILMESRGEMGGKGVPVAKGKGAGYTSEKEKYICQLE
jgi:hypothetical protein